MLASVRSLPRSHSSRLVNQVPRVSLDQSLNAQNTVPETRSFGTHGKLYDGTRRITPQMPISPVYGLANCHHCGGGNTGGIVTLLSVARRASHATSKNMAPSSSIHEVPLDPMTPLAPPPGTTSRSHSSHAAVEAVGAGDGKEVTNKNKNMLVEKARPDFSDATSAHGTKSTHQLLSALLVFHACRIPFLVKNAEFLLSTSTKLFGTTLTDAIMKHTFFNHFCAGENIHEMRKVIDAIGKSGIGPILDYAAESEGDDEVDNYSPEGGLEGLKELKGIFSQPPFNQPARIYDYKSERECDRHVEIFKDCIRAVREVSSPQHDDSATSAEDQAHNGFAALKVTALGNPELLERMSNVIVEVKNLFSKFDERGTGLISREEFVKCFNHYFHSDDTKLSEIIEPLDPTNTGLIDYISFAQMLTPYTLPTFTIKCKNVGPLALATPSDEEIKLMRRTSERLRTLAEEAAKCGTKLLIDAEHSKYQPAIDSLVLELQQEFNAKDKTDRPVIFNTYQCYLKDMPERMLVDLKRADRFNFHFAAKLVRGAYMVSERQRAKKLKISSPIHDTAEDTHRCYDETIELLLRRRVQNGPGLEVMVATHNKDSIEKSVKLMNELGLDPNDECVHFAQLYGMSDNLSFTLGKHGYNAFKYLPYGEVREVMPYLVRRAQENGDVLGNSLWEVKLLEEELKKRFLYS